MKNEYLERIYKNTEVWKAATKGERELAGAFKRSKDRGFDVLTYDGTAHANVVDEFIKAMEDAGVNEIYITGEWSNMLGVYLQMDEAGLKLRGVVRLENPVRKQELKRWGESYEAETIPALRFSFAK